MRILGIDPGLTALGYGVVVAEGGSLSYLDSGEIKTIASDSLGARLMRLHQATATLIETYQPAIVALERQIYCQNVQTAMTLGQVQGIVTLAAEEQDLEIWTLTPRELKQALTGGGHGGKEQVARSVGKLLRIDIEPLSDHATDALGAAIAYSNRSAIQRRVANANVDIRRRRR